MTKTLRTKYQPQWNFRTLSAAKKELKFQKRFNQDTFKWLGTKDIKVGGKRVSVRKIKL